MECIPIINVLAYSLVYSPCWHTVHNTNSVKFKFSDNLRFPGRQSIEQKYHRNFGVFYESGFWSLVPLPFLNPAWIPGSLQFTYCWSMAWKILNIMLLVCEMSAIVWEFEYSLTLLFFGIGMKTDLLQSCGHCWVFQIGWHVECSTFTFRLWNSSTGIPSPPLALFIVMLPKAHLTLHSRMSGSRWVIT